MRVILLAYHFPPTQEVGGRRAAKVAAALVAAGHEVTVIRAPSEVAGPEEVVTDSPIRVTTVIPPPGPRQLYAEIKAFFRRTPTQEAGDSLGSLWTPPTQVSSLKRLILSLMWLPDDQQGFAFAAARAAVRELQRGGAAILYSTSPPPSGQLAGLAAQLVTRATWVMELRDPWTDNPGKPWYCRTALTDSVERWLERRCLDRADAVVGVSEGVCNRAREKLEAAKRSKVILIRNGIEQIADPPARRPPGRPFRIVHVGTLYLGRDPRPFLRAAADVARRRALTEAELQIHLIGKSESFEGVPLRQFAADLGIGDLVRFESWLPHAEAWERLAEADLLLLLAEGQPDQVPNKLYEYLGARRPILGLADPQGETARLLEQAGGHYLATSSEPRIAALLEEALDHRDNLRPASPGLLESLASGPQMARLVAAVEALTPRSIR